MATEDDVYDVDWASSSYLYAFGTFSRHRNRQTRPQRFCVHDVLRRRDDLAEYARLVQELRLGNDNFHRYFRMSTKQFDYVPGLVGPHISRLPTVYVAVYMWHVQGRTASYGVVGGRTTLYAVVRMQCERHFRPEHVANSQNEHYMMIGIVPLGLVAAALMTGIMFGRNTSAI